MAPQIGAARRDLVSQYRSRTKFCPRKLFASSYRPLFDRLGNRIFSRGTGPVGIALRMWEMQLSRARRLSSERTIFHGERLLLVAFNIRSRAFEYCYHFRYDSSSIGMDIHLRD